MFWCGVARAALLLDRPGGPAVSDFVRNMCNAFSEVLLGDSRGLFDCSTASVEKAEGLIADSDLLVYCEPVGTPAPLAQMMSNFFTQVANPSNVPVPKTFGTASRCSA